MNKLLTRVLPPLLTLFVVTMSIELIVRSGWIREYLLPRPSQVIKALFEKDSDLWSAALQTAGTALAGFALAVVGGLLIAIALSTSKWIQRAFYPYAVFFQTVPIIAIAPLLVIWLDYGPITVIVSALIVSIFPMIANTLAGLLSTDPALLDLFKLYRSGRVKTLWKLKLPYALPNILTGVRISAGLAVIGAVVGEFITGRGLGSIVEVAKTQLRNDKVFAAVLLASLLGLLLFAGINLASRIALRHWHASEREI